MKHNSWRLLCALIVVTITSLYGSNPVQNRYYDELTEVLTENAANLPIPPANDYIDKLCLDILRAAAPINATIVRITAADFPRLYEFIKTCCDEQKMLVPRLFLSLDDHDIDVKFCTYDLEGGLLLHKKTFETFSSRVFRGYIQQTLLRMNKQFVAHTDQLTNRKGKQQVGIGAVSVANGALLLLSQLGDRANIASRICNLLQIGLAAGSAICLYRLFTQKMNSYSFQRVSSFHNQEQAREDIFPGTSPEQSLAPVFDAGPEHALDVIARTQAFIQSRNAEFDDLAEWEEEEEMEKRQIALAAHDKNEELEGS